MENFLPKLEAAYNFIKYFPRTYFGVHLQHGFMEMDYCKSRLTFFNLISGSFNPIHTGHWALLSSASKRNNLPSFFEISISNKDKGIISFDDLIWRISKIDGVVLITNAPNFRDKEVLFKNFAQYHIGYDTAVRILRDNNPPSWSPVYVYPRNGYSYNSIEKWPTCFAEGHLITPEPVDTSSTDIRNSTTSH